MKRRMKTTKILIAEDQAIMRDGLKTIFELEPDFEVIGAVTDGREAYERTLVQQPDVVLMDIQMPVMNGIESTRLIKNDAPHVKVLILTTFEDDEYVIDALRYGAAGYLLKDMDSEELVQLVRQKLEGHTVLPASVRNMLTVQQVSSTSEWQKVKQTLTQRELEVLSRIAKGLNNKEISTELGISLGTVSNYVSLIYDKIEIYDRSKLIVYLNSIHDFNSTEI